MSEMPIYIQYLFILLCVALGSQTQLDIYMYESLFDPDYMVPINKIIESRITGGLDSLPHAHPYTVGLNIRTESGKVIWCGGVLIDVEWVLTAGHCLKKGRDVTLHVGCHHRTKNCKLIKTDGSNIILHEKYNSRTLANDIGLIRLPRPVELNDKVQTIALPNQNRKQSYVGKWATATGWGIYSDSLRKLSNYLRVVRLPIVGRKSCQKNYTSILIRDSNICAASPGRKSTCAGDSGGPLVLSINGFHKILIGITSFGYKRGCEKGWPAVFTKVSFYVTWIKKHTGI